MTKPRRRKKRSDLVQLLKREDEVAAKLLAVARRLGRIRASRIQAERRSEAAARVVDVEGPADAASAVADVGRRSEAGAGDVVERRHDAESDAPDVQRQSAGAGNVVERRPDAASDFADVGLWDEATAGEVDLERPTYAAADITHVGRHSEVAHGDVEPLAHACTQCDVGPRAECLWSGRRPQGQRYHAARLRAARGSGGSP